MKIFSHGLTDVGKKRTRNEDTVLTNDNLKLYIVADGMGGHSGGEMASQMAVSTMEEVIKSINSDAEATVISGVNTDETDHGDRLKYAIQVASSRIHDRALFDQNLKGMGTTAVAAIFDDGYVYIAHVGDSRAYFFHANKMEQVTVDHSLVTEQIKAGLISEKDAKKHRLKNIITRSVGYQEEVEIDVKKISVHMGDRLLLCSDGLSNLVDDEQIQAIVNQHSLKEACELLVSQANENGGDDNVSVVLAEVNDLR